ATQRNLLQLHPIEQLSERTDAGWNREAIVVSAVVTDGDDQPIDLDIECRAIDLTPIKSKRDGSLCQSGLYVSVGESLIYHVGIHFELGGTRGQLAFAIRGVPSAVVAEDPTSGQGVPGLGGAKERVVRPADFGIETALTRRSRTATVGRARVATARTARAARAIAGVAPNAD